jgi:alkylhydroperoxidase family enzyme
MVGLTADQIRDSRQSVAVDSQTNTLLQFVHKVVEQRGQVDSHDVTSMKDAGFDDGQIAEAVVNVALSLLTNYFNIVADTVVDFPKAPPLAGAVAAN